MGLFISKYTIILTMLLYIIFLLLFYSPVLLILGCNDLYTVNCSNYAVHFTYVGHVLVYK